MLLESPGLGSLEQQLSNSVNDVLKARGDIVNNVHRAQALTPDIILINFHATFEDSDVFTLLKRYFSSVRFEEVSTIYKQVKDNEAIPNHRPVENYQSAGTTNDELGIDKRVKLLVDALNSIPGFTTFSSCDGHYHLPFYVLWIVTDNNLKKLNYVTKILADISNNVYSKYFGDPGKVRVGFYFNYDSWSTEERNGYGEYRDLPYFEFRIQMMIKGQWPEEFYNYTTELSEKFAEQIKDIEWKLL